jgi:L-xylulokinase
LAHQGHILKALFEGVIFNHRRHIDALRSSFRFSEIRLTGGGTRSELWRQMLADALDFPIEVTDAAEAGARGAALCAGVGSRIYGSLEEGVARAVRMVQTHEPDPEQHARLSEAYEVYTDLAEALAPYGPVWEGNSSDLLG